MNRRPRIVFDTNVVLSALIFTGGRTAALREVWRDAKCVPLVSTPTVDELIRALAYPKFKLSAPEQQELLAEYLPYCTAVHLPVKPPAVPSCRDPMDIPFLQLAAAGRADYLVTGDRDLLSLAKVFVCPIIGPDALLELIARR